MFNFNKVEFLKNDGFDIFEIKNFLDFEYYKKIKSNLPTLKIEDFDKKYTINKKIGLQPNDGEYERVILSNPTLYEFHNNIYSKDFIKKIINLFKIRIFKSRLVDINYLLKLIIRNNNFVLQNKKKNFYEKILFNNIYPSIQYSFMFNGSKIVPHTDSRAKLISLMLYFPDESLSENDYNKLGTSFYNSKNKNFTNTHLLDEENERLFKEQSKKFLTLPFKPYNLYGFIRTDKSWHTVEKINMHENFIRKSININILFD